MSHAGKVVTVVRGGEKSRGANARLIEELMAKEGVRGSPKDWCVVAGGRVVDHRGAYDAPSGVSVSGVKLVHKKDLWRVVGDEFAARFWSRKLGMRLAGPPSSVSEGL